MKLYRLFILFVLISSSIYADYRTWTDYRGRTIFAELVSYSGVSDEDSITLVKSDGDQKIVKIRNLAAVDRKYVLDTVSTIENQQPNNSDIQNDLFDLPPPPSYTAQLDTHTSGSKKHTVRANNTDYTPSIIFGVFIVLVLGLIIYFRIHGSRKDNYLSSEDVGDSAPAPSRGISTNTKNRPVRWGLRITLWIIWFIVWAIPLTIVSALLDVFRKELVNSALQTGNFEGTAQLSGIVVAVTMSIMLLLLVGGFSLINRWTQKKAEPAGPGYPQQSVGFPDP